MPRRRRGGATLGRLTPRQRRYRKHVENEQTDAMKYNVNTFEPELGIGQLNVQCQHCAAQTFPQESNGMCYFRPTVQEDVHDNFSPMGPMSRSYVTDFGEQEEISGRGDVRPDITGFHPNNFVKRENGWLHGLGDPVRLDSHAAELERILTSIPYDEDSLKRRKSISNPVAEVVEVKEEVFYCQNCLYSDISVSKLKAHMLNQHPAKAAVILNNLIEESQNLTDVMFFCVRETCAHFTSICYIYEDHIMRCCSPHTRLTGKEKQRLEASVKFLLVFHRNHGFNAAIGFLDFVSKNFKAFVSTSRCESSREKSKLVKEKSKGLLQDTIPEDNSLRDSSTYNNYDCECHSQLHESNECSSDQLHAASALQRQVFTEDHSYCSVSDISGAATTNASVTTDHNFEPLDENPASNSSKHQMSNDISVCENDKGLSSPHEKSISTSSTSSPTTLTSQNQDGCPNDKPSKPKCQKLMYASSTNPVGCSGNAKTKKPIPKDIDISSSGITNLKITLSQKSVITANYNKSDNSNLTSGLNSESVLSATAVLNSSQVRGNGTAGIVSPGAQKPISVVPVPAANSVSSALTLTLVDGNHHSARITAESGRKSSQDMDCIQGQDCFIVDNQQPEVYDTTNGLKNVPTGSNLGPSGPVKVVRKTLILPKPNDKIPTTCQPRYLLLTLKDPKTVSVTSMPGISTNHDNDTASKSPKTPVLCSILPVCWTRPSIPVPDNPICQKDANVTLSSTRTKKKTRWNDRIVSPLLQSKDFPLPVNMASNEEVGAEISTDKLSQTLSNKNSLIIDCRKVQSKPVPLQHQKNSKDVTSSEDALNIEQTVSTQSAICKIRNARLAQNYQSRLERYKRMRMKNLEQTHADAGETSQIGKAPSLESRVLQRHQLIGMSSNGSYFYQPDGFYAMLSCHVCLLVFLSRRSFYMHMSKIHPTVFKQILRHHKKFDCFLTKNQLNLARVSCCKMFEHGKILRFDKSYPQRYHQMMCKLCIRHNERAVLVTNSDLDININIYKEDHMKTGTGGKALEDGEVDKGSRTSKQIHEWTEKSTREAPVECPATVTGTMMKKSGESSEESISLGGQVNGPSDSANLLVQCCKCMRVLQHQNFTRTQKLERHPQFVCTLCWKTFSQVTKFNCHMTQYHTGDLLYAQTALEMNLEEQFLKSVQHIIFLREHARENPLQCPQCRKAFIKKENLLIHMTIHVGEETFQCSECGKAFLDKHVLKAHMRRHTGEKPYRCAECGREFSYRIALKTHERRHTGEKPYACAECGKAFSQYVGLKFHERRHHGEKLYQCKDCDQSFYYMYQLEKHRMTHTGVYPYICQVCHKGFTQKSSLTIHMRNHNGTKPFKCQDCGKGFTVKASLKSHMRTHSGEKPFSCSQCGQRFSQRASLRCHMQKHTGEKPFSCDECGRKFSQSNSLKAHMRTHSGEKPFSCSQCGQRFSQRASLRCHMQRHTGEKPFSCDECGRRFTQKNSLNMHMKTHTGEKPFLCSDCGKRFTQRMSLESHMKTHSGEKPFSCSQCGRNFSQKGSLQSHMKTHTGEKPFRCDECGQQFSQRAGLRNHTRKHSGKK